MKYAFVQVAFGLGANALVARQASQCTQLQASGGQSGVLGQLSDGQNRIGGGHPTGCYCLSSNGGFTDSNGRGCILTPPTTQFQCDVGASPTTGFDVGSDGSVTHDGSSTFYACPATDSEYNVYTTPVDGQDKCVEISLSSAGSCGAGSAQSSAPAASQPAISSAVPQASQPATDSAAPVPSEATQGYPAQSQPAESFGAPRPSGATQGYPAHSQPAQSFGAPMQPGATQGYPVHSQPAQSFGAPMQPEATQGYPAQSQPAESFGAPRPSGATQGYPAHSQPAQSFGAPMQPGATQGYPVHSQPAQSFGAPRPSGATQGYPAHSQPAQSFGAPMQPGATQGYPVHSQPAESFGAPRPSGATQGYPAQSQPAESSAPAVQPSAPVQTETVIQSETLIQTQTQTAPEASATATAPSAPGQSDNACPADLNGAYEYPHLVVPVDSQQPSKSYGTSYNGKIDSHTCTIFNFDIPASYSGQTCSVVFLFPEQEDLETSSFTYSGSGMVDFTMLKGPASEQTTYDNQPAMESDLASMSIAPGNSYTITSGECAAGQTVTYEICGEGDFSLDYFQDYNPSPLGLYVRAC